MGRVLPHNGERVADFMFPPADKGADDGVLLGGFGLLPLLHLDDDGGALPVLIGAGENDVDPRSGWRGCQPGIRLWWRGRRSFGGGGRFWMLDFEWSEVREE